MADYRDFWEEYRAIQGSLHKKLLKKPNYQDAIKQFRVLANSMEEMEMFDQAALCHREIAKLFATKLESSHLGRRHLLKAAQLYHSAQIHRKQVHSNGSSELSQLMEQCYLEAIDQMLRQTPASLQIVALTYFELACRLESLDEWQKTLIYLQKANRFVQQNVFVQIQLLQKMCALAPKFANGEREELFAAIDSLWTQLAKLGGQREQLLRLEAHILLLHLRHSLCSPCSSISHKGNHQFLANYDGSWRDGMGARSGSVANRKEFVAFSQLVAAVHERDHSKASEVCAIDLAGVLTDAPVRRLCAQILNELNMAPVENPEIDAILASPELTELQKREKMFELCSGATKNGNFSY